MNEAVSRLLQLLPGEDPETRREVVLRLALVLELNAIASASREANRADYALTLPEELLDVELSRADRIEILQILHDSFLAAPESTEILWAMGKARLPEAVDLLLDIIAVRGDDLSEDARFQAVCAIERYVFQKDCDLSGGLEPRLHKLVERRTWYVSERVGEVLAYLEGDLRRPDRHAG